MAAMGAHLRSHASRATKRSGVSCSPGMLTAITSNEWVACWFAPLPRRLGRAFLQVKGSLVQIRAVKAGPEQQQPLTGGADQAAATLPRLGPRRPLSSARLWMLFATVGGAARRAASHWLDRCNVTGPRPGWTRPRTCGLKEDR